MAYPMTFLTPRSGKPVTKTHANPPKLQYREKFWSSQQIDAQNMLEFYELIRHQAELGNVLLASQLVETLSNQPRAGKANKETLFSWYCFDLDGTGYNDPQEFIDNTDWLQNTSYIVQYSASHGIAPQIPGKSGLRCHIFVLLSRPVAWKRLQNVTKQLNLTDTQLLNDQTLSREKSRINYSLDPAMAQPSQLITISPPLCEAPYADTMTPETRITLVTRPNNTVNVDNIPIIDAEELSKRENARLNELRASEGLSKISRRTRADGGFEVAQGIVPVTLHHLTDDRGFSYYNYEDGDSNSYYHPLDKPELIYSFKPGLLPMLHEELDPDSYSAATLRALKYKLASDKPVFGIFYDDKQDKTFSFSLDNAHQHLEMNTISVMNIENFCQSHSVRVPDPIPRLRQEFNMKSGNLLDADAKTANTFVEPVSTRGKIIAEAPQYTPGDCTDTLFKRCPHIHTLISYPAGGDLESFPYIINWLAALTTHRRKPETIIAMQGVQGTGKDLLVQYVFEPLLGQDYVMRTDQRILTKKFNQEFTRNRLIVINEVNVKYDDPDNAYQKLKDLSTAHRLPIRRMRQDRVSMEDIHFGLLLFSNQPGFLPMDESDRRLLVLPRQNTPLRDAGVLMGFNMENQIDEFLQCVNQEIPDFIDYLYNFDLDHDMLLKVPQTAARAEMIEASKTGATLFCEAIKKGDLSHFLDLLNITVSQNALERAGLGFNLEAILADAIKFSPEPMPLTMDHLLSLYFYATHEDKISPQKLKRLLVRHDISFTKVKNPYIKGHHTVSGVSVHWNITEDDIAAARASHLTLPENLPAHLTPEKLN